MRSISPNAFSLVQLMVGLALGMIVTAVIVQVFINNRHSDRISSAFSEVKANAYFIDHYLKNVVRRAGYRSEPSQNYAVGFQSMDSIFTEIAPHVEASNATGPNNSDTLIIRYQGSGNGQGTPDNLMLDCLNSGVDSQDIVTNTFYINNDFDLICEAQNETSGQTKNLVLLSNIESFQVLLGEDINDDLLPDRYVSPGYTNLDFQKVTAIKIAYLIRSDDNITKIADTKSYNLVGELFSAPGDNRLRKTFISSIYLRNFSYDIP